MSSTPPRKAPDSVSNPVFSIIGWMLLAGISFHTAQNSGIGLLMVPCCLALLRIAEAASWRLAIYPLLVTGLLFYAPQLSFFGTIFGAGAAVLWLILAAWIVLFGIIYRCARRKFGPNLAWSLSPIIWTGIEYLRGEVYPLRFTWLITGNAFWKTPWLLTGIGVYGAGFICMAAAILAARPSQGQYRWQSLIPSSLIIATAVIAAWATWRERRLPSTPGLEIAGVQLEFPAEPVILEQLDHLIQVHPKAQLIVLSEYSFDGPIPGAVRDWCRSRGKYLIAGGKHWLTGGQYYNTAYVIGPDGQVQFEQAKAQPIQFFHDGLPAPRQQVWQSPWGPIGILICYDLSYARVVDELVRQGARLIIAPTMDVRNWGEHEHELNARTAPLRAAEYGIPIFRLCSSGISQIVAADGTVLASAPFPGQRAMIQGRINLDSRPALPLDRILGPVCALGIVLLTVWLLGSGLTNRVRRHFKTNSGFLC